MTPTKAQIETKARELHGPDAYGNPPLHYDQLSERWKNEWRKMARDALTPTKAQIEAAAKAIAGPFNIPGECSYGIAQAALTAAAEADGGPQVQSPLSAACDDAFDKGYRRGKATTIERCAQVAESFQLRGLAECTAAMKIAAAIRARKDKP